MAILATRMAVGRATVLALVAVGALAHAPSARADGCGTQLPRPGAPAVTCPPAASFIYSPASSPIAPVAPGTTFSFDGFASRGSDGGPVSTYEWDWGTGTYGAPSGSPSATHAFPARGAYVVSLRITDTSVPPVMATTSRTVYVGAAPTASFTVDRQATSQHQAVGFSGAASEPGYAGAFTYKWDFDGDGTYDDSASGAAASHVYAAAGSYTPTLQVIDDIGVTATYALPAPIVASNQPPVARISLSASSIPVGGAITLNGSASSDADSGGALTYAWDFDGDGGFEMAGAPAVLSHSFPNPGVYNIHLRVTDVDGGSGVATATLTVTAPGGGGGGNGTIDGGGPLGTGDGTGTPSGSGNGTSNGGGAQSSNAFTAGLAGSAIQKLKVVRKRGLVLTCTASRAATCSVTAWISAKDAKRLGLRVRGKRPVKLGVGSAKVLPKRAGALPLRAAGQAGRALRRAKTLRITVQGAASDGSGHTALLSRAVLVRR
ncbi:MAG: PKD domain-containing protein [Actinomycetota bacterium]|nr:PKD domain-containing protein [Actinomycetota bacterium]